MLGAVVTGESFGDSRFCGFDPSIAQAGQGAGVALSGENGIDNR